MDAIFKLYFRKEWLWLLLFVFASPLLKDWSKSDFNSENF